MAGTPNETNFEQFFTNYLVEQKASIPQVAMQLPTIREVQTNVFWEQLSTSVSYALDTLERVRCDLRGLVQFLTGEMNNQKFDVDIEDLVTYAGSALPLNIQMTYRQRVMDWLDEHRDYAALQKIYRMEQLSVADIRELERIFWQDLGTKEEYESYLERSHRLLAGDNIAAFLRSVIGIDREAAREKYIALIQDKQMTSMQEEYLRSILDYVCENGDITTQTMRDEPFSTYDWIPVFGDNTIALRKYIDTIHQSITA